MANKSVGLLTIAFGADLRGFDRAMKTASKKITRFGNQMKNVGRNLTMRVTLPVLGLAAASVKLASDMEESMNKVDVAFGDSAGHVKAFTDTTTERFGIAKVDALEMAALFGDMGTSLGFTRQMAAGMSTELVSLAGDLSSFKNIDVATSQKALSGIFTGQTRTLQDMGINITKNALENSKFFKSLNKNFSALTLQEKILVRYNAVLEQTENTTGDFVRTQESFANQSRILQAEVKNIGSEIGATLLPVAVIIIKKVREWAKTFRELSDEKKNLIVKIALISAALGPVLIMLGSLTTIIVNGVVPAILLASKAMNAFSRAVMKNKILALVAIITSIGIEVAKAHGLLEEFNFLNKDTSKIMDEGAKSIAAVENELAKLETTLEKGMNFDDLLGDAGGEKDLFGIDVEAEKKRAREVALAIKQEYLGLVEGKKITQEEFNQQMASAELFHLDEMRSLYEKHGKDLSDIDNQIHDNMIANMENESTAASKWEESLLAIGSAMGSQFKQGAESFAEFGGMVKSVIKDIIGGLIAEGVAAAVSMSLKNPVFAIAPFMIPVVAGLAAGLARTAFNTLIPSFAEGGIVSAPMLAQVGDAPSGPEVIAPLDKLKSMLGSNQQQIEVVGRIAGDDIWLSNRKTGFNRFRSV